MAVTKNELSASRIKEIQKLYKVNEQLQEALKMAYSILKNDFDGGSPEILKLESALAAAEGGE